MVQEIPTAAIAALYEAAAAPGRWPGALRDLTDAVGCAVGHLMVADKSSGRPVLSVMAGPLDNLDSGNEAFLAYYASIDPRLPLALATRVGNVFACHHHFDDSFVAHNEFYNDFLIPHGVRYIATAHLLESTRETTFFSLLHRTGEEPFDAAELRLLCGLIPHLRGALRVHQMVGRLTAENHALQAALDGLDQAVYLVDAAGRVVYMNPRGQSLIEARDGLMLVAGQLAAAAAADATRLRALVSHATAGVAATRDPRASGGEIAIRRPSGQPPLLAAVLPLRDELAARLDSTAARAAVHVIDPTSLPVGAGPRLAALLGLTPAEQRLALALLEGQCLSEIAEARGVSRETLRSQLDRLFAKTETRRQSQLLVRLARCLALPE